MAMRRPRIKVAANLSIRRPTKPAGTGSDAAKPSIAGPPVDAKHERKDDQARTDGAVETRDNSDVDGCVETRETKELKHSTKPEPILGSTPSPAAEQSAFKFPRPVEDPPRLIMPPQMPHSPLDINSEELHSPKKLDSKFAYINALNSPRKRIRTESITSNKSYSDVSLKSRKTIKQEESQKASDAKRDLRKRLNNIQNIDKQSLTMFDMIYYNPVKNPMTTPALSKKGSLENIPHAVDRESRSVSKSRSPTPAPVMPPPPDPPKPLPQLTPQLKLGPNGEMILDEASLVIENEREKEIRDTLAKTEIVYDDEFSGNSGYYSRFKRTRDWAAEETIRFYRCLHTIGTDFSMMIQLFPNRSRRDLKLKFKKEERLNLMLINKALLHPKEFNIEELQQQFEEEDEEIERQREQERQIKAELEESLRQQKLDKKQQLHQNKMRNPKKRVSKSARVMLDGERLDKAERLQKESKPKRKRRKAAVQGRQVKREAVAPNRKFTIISDEEGDDDAFEDAANNSPGLDESDHERIADVREVEVDGVPYVPNGEFTQPVLCPMERSRSPAPETVASKSKPPEVSTSEIPLDISSMDIDVVDEEARSLYEIKAEPKVFPVQIYGNSNKDNDPPNVITLQNLDDHSQTTVAYREPKVCTDLIVGDQQDNGIDSIESKYYGGCDVVYIPMPANAPIAHPVKTEMYSQSSQVSVPPPLQSPPLHYDLHPVSEPAYVGGTATDRRTIKRIVEPEQKPDPVPEPKPAQEPEPEPEIKMPKPVIEDLPKPLLVPSKVEQEQPAEEDDSQPAQEEGEPEEPRGLGPLEDIDINSLVLVESQDTTNPDRTIYEIYVIDPETGKLSEKPLDVPEDVIENIRSILEVGED